MVKRGYVHMASAHEIFCHHTSENHRLERQTSSSRHTALLLHGKTTNFSAVAMGIVVRRYNSSSFFRITTHSAAGIKVHDTDSRWVGLSGLERKLLGHDGGAGQNKWKEC
ncbi:hypothetical protein C8J43_104514 [Sphingomonas sp. PP-CE-1G-424]|nr:hypothetical protein C8J43_104514 [Sphingomonas sp. PP-CE-1G-424]